MASLCAMDTLRRVLLYVHRIWRAETFCRAALLSFDTRRDDAVDNSASVGFDSAI